MRYNHIYMKSHPPPLNVTNAGHTINISVRFLVWTDSLYCSLLSVTWSWWRVQLFLRSSVADRLTDSICTVLCACVALCITRQKHKNLPHIYVLNAVRCPYVRNGRRGQLSSEWRHNENGVTMTIAGLLRYGDWRHVATGCTALVCMTVYNDLALS